MTSFANFRKRVQLGMRCSFYIYSEILSKHFRLIKISGCTRHGITNVEEPYNKNITKKTTKKCIPFLAQRSKKICTLYISPHIVLIHSDEDAVLITIIRVGLARAPPRIVGRLVIPVPCPYSLHDFVSKSYPEFIP